MSFQPNFLRVWFPLVAKTRKELVKRQVELNLIDKLEHEFTSPIQDSEGDYLVWYKKVLENGDVVE